MDYRVLEQVGEGALELGRVGAQRRQVVVERQPHLLAVGADRLARRVEQVDQVDWLAMRLGRTRFESGDVEAGSRPVATGAAPPRPPRRRARGARRR